ncbi:MAG: nitroreductase [Oscillospiraceae bacterium]|nr:nitroreductase [Oscillospiraceae bacterium]
MGQTESPLREMISRRRSVRSYEDTPVDQATVERILDFCHRAKPLDPRIRVDVKVVTDQQVRNYLRWKSPQMLAIFSQEMPGHLENVGFLFQQVDLFIQSLGLGSCWLGLGKLREPIPDTEGMCFVMLIAFGHPLDQELRWDVSQFQRKALSQICDREDICLEPARLAPSGTNSQPWYFTHVGDRIDVYRSLAGEKRHWRLGNVNRIDMGIALAHLYVTYPETFRFFTAEAAELEGHGYTGSITI